MIYLKLYYTFLKIGAFSFGGGYAMLPLIQKEIIYNNNWIDHNSFIDIIATSQMTPGPIAINSATFIGYKIGGVLGSAVSTIGVVTVPVILILIISRFVAKFKESKMVESIFTGLRPALVGLILASAYSVGKTAIFDISSLLIALFIFFIVNRIKLHPILAIIISAFLGLIIYT